jgi:hypothetical protein
MSKSPNTRKKTSSAATLQGASGRKPAKTARRTATSGKGGSQSRHRGNGARRNVKAVVRNGTKQAMLIDLLDSAGGASVPEMAAKTGWQPHSVRGAISGTLKKKLGLTVESEVVEDRGRVYRIAARG